MPRTVSSKWRNKKRGTYAIVGAFALVIPFILLSYYVFGQHSKASSTLQLVTVIFRHGDRTPTHFYPRDPYKDSKYWPDGLGALTKEGKLQAFKLGQIFRKQYDGFISEKYSPEDVYVFSSDHDRCLMSAQLCLAALFPPVGEQIWNKEINWQPIPVHTVPRSSDKLITVKKPCPKYEKELNQTYNSNHFAKINAENAELYEYLTQHSGTMIKNLAQLESLYNTLEVEVQSNLKLPDWAEKVYDKKLKNLAALSLAAFTFTDTTKRLKGGPLLGEIVKQMSQKVLGTLKPDRKLYLYSAHDLTMISVLRALGFEELFKPEYAASMIFELHQPLDGGDHIVELLYLNNTHHDYTMRLKIPNCDEMCKLKDFLKLTKPFVPEDWEAECESN